MELTTQIPQQEKIYLDTNLFIYFFEDNPKYANKVEDILTLSTKNKTAIISSTLLLSELLVSPYKTKDDHLLQVYENIDKAITNLSLIPLNKKIATKAALIRAKYGIKTPDAIHLATAINQQANIFITADKQLSRVKEIKTIVL